MVVPSGARCGQHPEVAAVDVCLRCGRFLCGDCVELVREDTYCTDCARRVNTPATRLAKGGFFVGAFAWASPVIGLLAAAFFAVPMLGFSVALALPASVSSMLIGLVCLLRLRRGDGNERDKPWAISSLVLGALLLLTVAALIVFIITVRP